MSVYYDCVRALIDPEQSDVLPDGSLRQDVSLILVEGSARPGHRQEAAIATLSASEARELAFELLALAEQVERIGGRR